MEVKESWHYVNNTFFLYCESMSITIDHAQFLKFLFESGFCDVNETLMI